jgi:hypothetical protein
VALLMLASLVIARRRRPMGGEAVANLALPQYLARLDTRPVASGYRGGTRTR